MQELVYKFEAELSSDPVLLELYSDIKSVLVENYKTPIDIEAILSVVEGVKTRKPTDMGHYVFYYMRKSKIKFSFSMDKIDCADKLYKKLTSYIGVVCNSALSDTEKMEIYQKSYMPLFEHMHGESTTDVKGIGLKRDWKAYTTNYDTLFEYFWNGYDPPDDHFEKQGMATTYFFRSKPLPDYHTFSKLHGSLDWKVDSQTGTIIKKSFPSIDQHQAEGPVILFPIQQKDLYLDPWFALFENLKQGLRSANNLYVVGYAFNDEFIRNAFQESLTSRNSVSLILIDPNAEQIKNKFNQSVLDKIETLPITFGSEYFPQVFQDYATNRKTITVTFSHPFASNTPDPVQVTLRCNLETQYAQIGDIKPVKMSRPSNSHELQLELDNSQQFSIKVELSISHHDETIKLDFLSNSDKLSFSVIYAGNRITDSEQTLFVKSENQIQCTVKMDTSDLFPS